MSSNLFDRLQEELEQREKEGGITPLDLVDLPVPMKRLMRLMLREVEMSKRDLLKAVQEMPESERIEIDELEKTTAALVKQEWLIALGEGERKRFRVNLKKKSRNQISAGIWNNLDSQIKKRQEERAKKEEKPKSGNE